MAHYFKFKSLAEIQSQAHRLGLDLVFQEDLSPLFTPQPVGGITVGNRLCIQPMEGCDGTLAGAPGELTFRRFQRFGAGGAKLIWGEAAAVVPEGRANPRQLLLAPEHQSALARLADTARQAHRAAFGRDDDLLLGLQLTHSGRYSYLRPLAATRDPLLDPRTIADRATGRTLDSGDPLLTDDDLRRLQDAFVAAAGIAYRAGFQFVDLKQCHRYLLNELLAAHTRPGPFGGSYENRTRFAREVIQRLRTDVPGLMLATRLNLYDGLPFHRGATGLGQPDAWNGDYPFAWGTHVAPPHGPDLAEPIRWLAEMQDLGVVLANVSLGNPYASPHLLRPFEYPPPDGYQTPEPPLVGVHRHVSLAAQAQQAVPELPCVGSGYSYLQEFLFHAGAANVATGRITFVGVGRASLSQPDFAKQLMDHGTLDRRRVCRTFSYCTALMRSKHNEFGQFAAGCPPFDNEVYGPEWDAAKVSRAAAK